METSSKDKVSRLDPTVLSNLRKYYENGCRCIWEGRLKECGSDVSDMDAVNFYNEKCECSRSLVR